MSTKLYFTMLKAKTSPPGIVTSPLAEGAETKIISIKTTIAIPHKSTIRLTIFPHKNSMKLGLDTEGRGLA
jgi:hypothetical protein